MNDVLLIVAGSIALLGAAVHAVGGELLVVRKLSTASLPSSRFGGPRTTRSMIHVAWHLATIGLLTVGFALLAAGAVVHGDAARGVAVVGACTATACAALTLGLGGVVQSPRTLFRHPAPIALTATAALAWLGAL